MIQKQYMISVLHIISAIINHSLQIIKKEDEKEYYLLAHISEINS